MVHSTQLLSAALGAGLASIGPTAYDLAAPTLFRYLPPYLLPKGTDTAPVTVEETPNNPFRCAPDQGYRTELISADPLLIYIHDFVSPREAELVVRAGEALLQPSPVTGYGGDTASQVRTSWSAPLPEVAPSTVRVDNTQDDAEAAVACVLARAEAFLGTVLRPGHDDMGAAQLVHYEPGQQFKLHHDWFRQPRLADADAAAGRRRLYNRVATFFVVLQANCTAGETYFPEARPIGFSATEGEGWEGRIWRPHEKGGLAFRPIAGNALFWPNIFANGSGDARTLHAGLPVGEGTKTAMNIWPRTFFGPDA